MIVRDFILSDLDDVLRIEFEAFPDPYPMNIILQLVDAGVGFLVAELARNVVGYIIFWVKNGDGHIIAIAVDSKFQDMEVGTVLLDKTRAIFKRNNIHKIFLEVRKSNTHAIHFYHKNGFVQIKQEENYYNDGEDAIIMQYANHDDLA